MYAWKISLFCPFSGFIQEQDVATVIEYLGKLQQHAASAIRKAALEEIRFQILENTFKPCQIDSDDKFARSLREMGLFSHLRAHPPILGY